MWEKFKNSKFAKTFKDGWGRGGAVITVFCLILALAVVLSVSIATNRAKKKYAGENDGMHNPPVEDNTNPNGNDAGNEQSGNNHDNQENKPSDNDEEKQPVNGEIEEFELSLVVEGVISKGHDASIQVWSNTMEDYRVHLGVDLIAEEGTPVYAAADGEVSRVWDDPLMGRCVAISHGDNIYTYYKNLDATLADGITQGAQIKCGDEIGKVGETAIVELADEPHLHLEMTVNGLAVDPRDYFSDEALDVMSRDTSYESNAISEENTEATTTGK